MLTYIVRRIVIAIPLIFGVLTLTFFIIRLAPGDPTALYLAPGISPKVAEQLREQFGLNDPLPIQYVKWLSRVVQGDFGQSFSRMQPVFDVIAEAVPITLLLLTLALTLAVFLRHFAWRALCSPTGHAIRQRANHFSLVYLLNAGILALANAHHSLCLKAGLASCVWRGECRCRYLIVQRAFVG